MGFLTKALGVGEQKATVASFDTVNVQPYEDWYLRNGYVGSWGPYDDFTKRAVGPDTALEASAVYACVKILGEDMASMPFQVFRRSNGRIDQARDDWRWELLHGMANPEMSSGEFVEAMTATAALTGNAFADIDRWDNGNRAWLWPRDPATVTLHRGNRAEAPAEAPGAITYELKGQGEKTSREVFHFRGFSFDAARGDEVLTRARRVLGLYLSAQEYAGRYFSQGIHSDLIFSHPGMLGPNEVENILTAWRRKQGVGKAGEPAVLGEGMSAARLSPDLRRQQMIQSRQFQLLEVCRIFRIQPHKLSELERTTFNNVEELQIDHVVNTLGRWRRRWREAVHRHLLTPEEQSAEAIFAEHSVEAQLRGNFEKQADGWTKLILQGVYSINEVRAWLNMNPVEGGDTHRVQMQMQDIQQVATAVVKMLEEKRCLAKVLS